jgi:hypothetical protein
VSAADQTYEVTIYRAGVSPLRLRTIVSAQDEQAAGELASVLAERERGGSFDPVAIRRTAVPAASADAA